MPFLTLDNLPYLLTPKGSRKPKPKPKPKRTAAEVRAQDLRDQIHHLLSQRACTTDDIARAFSIRRHIADEAIRRVWREQDSVERHRQQGRGRGYIYYTPDTKPEMQRLTATILHRDPARIVPTATQIHRLLLATPDLTVSQMVERTIYNSEVITRALTVLYLARLVQRHPDDSPSPHARYRPTPNTKTYDGV